MRKRKEHDERWMKRKVESREVDTMMSDKGCESPSHYTPLHHTPTPHHHTTTPSHLSKLTQGKGLS
ncbi:hypothetical protein E2C01_089955 [Portunus trituberculatus]|uniref:Uncharacterized protein n=1 Tax=Portunus trituberculatus TaxID=210409 RepID=A0A5B7JA75_PORTR|nr:hypothetical protein [Portunus trituberculatus]